MCDCLVALPPTTRDGETLFAKNSDRPPDEIQDLFWSPPRRDRQALRATHIAVAPHERDTLGCLLSVPRWCWGAEHGVNEAGVAIGNTAVYTTLDPRSAAPALIGMDLVRLGLERAGTAQAAADVIIGLLERYGQGGSGHDPNGVHGAKPYWSSFLIADGNAAFVIDTSGQQWQMATVRDARAISNRTSIAAFDAAHRHPRQPVAARVDARLAASRRVLGERPVTVESLMTHLRSHDSCVEMGWSVCMHAVDAAGMPLETTSASMVAALRPTGQPQRAWVLTGSPCIERYREVIVGEQPSGASFQRRPA